MKVPSAVLWIIAFLVAGSTLVYQKITGPTYPKTVRAVVDGHDIKVKLPRSSDKPGNEEFSLDLPDPAITGVIEFRRFRSNDEWTRQPLQRKKGNLVATLPHQPPAGKVAYKITLEGSRGGPVALSPEPVVLRFRGAVPTAIVIPHVLGMVIAMMLAIRAGLEALLKRGRAFPLTVGAAVALAIGGILAGAIMQKAAFGAYWTGWPFGHDLTDNKTLVVFLFWLVALWRTAKNRSARGWVLAASALTLVIWLIPHSVLGSELDYTRMQP